LKLA
jgi:hypothetical protein